MTDNRDVRALILRSFAQRSDRAVRPTPFAGNSTRQPAKKFRPKRGSDWRAALTQSRMCNWEGRGIGPISALTWIEMRSEIETPPPMTLLRGGSRRLLAASLTLLLGFGSCGSSALADSPAGSAARKQVGVLGAD